MVKRCIYVQLICILISCSMPLIAQASTTEISIGSAISSFTYHESEMEEKGILTGIHGYIAIHQQWMMRLDGSLVSGNVNYSSTDTGSMSDIPDYIFEIRGLTGPDIYTGNWRITPYTGLGYRYLNDNSAYRTTSTDDSGYEREQSYTYLPVGIIFHSFGYHWATTTQLEIDILLRGENHTRLGTIPGYNNLSFHQTKGTGARASLTLTRRVKWGPIKGLALMPYIKYWNINASNDVRQGDEYYYEPHKHSTEYGISFLLTV
ncbi:MAG: hypothetical protein CENE_03771 [Candidatus Celerinatantimonas neptuna]|nr:MAG: hypothetical protein CENE_03771 [Candidatus Celerinatantimonas neptuna]